MFIAVCWLIYRPRFAPEFVWPNPARVSTYGYQIALYAVLIVAFVFLGFRVSAEESVIACAAVPYTALLLTFWCFRLYPGAGDGSRRDARGGLLFPAVLSGLTAIVFVSVLVAQWPYSKHLTLLLGVAGIAVVPLLRRPRVYIVRTFRRGTVANRRERLDLPSSGPGHSATGPATLSPSCCCCC